MRALLLTFAAAAASLAAAGAGDARPRHGNECEAVSRTAGSRVVCVGALPASRTTVALKSRSGSGEHGFAVVTFGLHETRVAIRLFGAPAGAAQPARIRKGGCLGKTVSNLGNVVDGRRLARVDPLPHVSGYAVVVYGSAVRGAEVVACGVIPHRRHRP